MGNNMSLGYDGEDEQEQQEQEQQEQEQQEQEQEQQEQQEEQKQEHSSKKNDNIKKSSIKNKESANASVSESVSESIEATKIKKRKQTVRNLKASKKAGKTKSNKRILKEYQSRYINGEKEREQRATSTLLNSD